MHAPSEEEGLSLLIHGSPIPDDETGTSDEHLLDYDSDADHPVATNDSSKNEQATAQGHVISATLQNTDVDMDQSAAGPSGQISDAAGSTSPQDAVYFQCRSARTAGYKDTLVSVSQDESFGKKLTVQSPMIGTFEDHDNLASTFHGSRVTKGNTTINQSVSMSFDPSKLNCFCCGNEHPVITKKPAVIMFSDQNFVSSLSCNNENCIHIVRIENASLWELAEMAKEIFGDATFPEGSILLFGSASHLGRNGTTLYARDWAELVAATSN
jgi:hypothetical protein